MGIPISDKAVELTNKIADVAVALVTGLAGIAKEAVADNNLGLTDVGLVNDLFKTIKEAIEAFKG